MIKRCFQLFILFFAISLEANEKPICVIYGNCQTQPVYEYLKKYHRNLYDYNFILSYLALKGQVPFDKEKLENADLFIYQHVADRFGEMSTNHIIKKVLKESCVTIVSQVLALLDTPLRLFGEAKSENEV